MEPRWASENLPFFVPVASVNAPLTWPKSSDSSSVSGMAAQLTLMNGRSRCALQLCMARATSSLPVPVSPVIKHRAAGRRHQLDATDHVGDRAALADDAVAFDVLSRFASHKPLSRLPPTPEAGRT